jgi:lipoate-protein ligase A
MKEQWRFLNLGYVEPISYWSYPEAVTIAKSRGLVPNTVVFSIPKRTHVNIGYYQDVEKEVRLDLCKSMDIEVVRRYGLGGGALLYNDDSRLFHIIVDSNRFPEDYVQLMLQTSRGLLEAVRNVGIEADFVPINDVMTKSGKKIGMCSNFRTDYGNVSYITISLHRDVDVELAMKVLTPPPEKFKDKTAQTVKDRITTLGKELQRDISSDELIEAVRRGFEKAYDIDLKDGPLAAEEQSYYNEAVKRNGTHQFLYKYSEGEKFGKDLDLVKKGALRRSEFVYKGAKLVRVVTLTDANSIRNIMISGDYYAYPWDMTDRLESALKGCPMGEEHVRERIIAGFRDAGGEIALMSPEEFITTVNGALNQKQ